MRHSLFAAPAGLLCCILAEAKASITYLSQTRYVRVSTDINGQPGGPPTMFATGFSDFNIDFTAHLPQDFVSGSANQHSRILPDAIEMTGGSHASITTASPLGSVIQVTSYLEVRFDVDTPTPFLLSGNRETQSSPPPVRVFQAIARLTGPGVVIDWNDDSGGLNTWPSSPASGLLLPGSYTLVAAAYAERANSIPGFPGTNESSVAVRLALPAPASCPVIAAVAVLAARRRRG